MIVVLRAAWTACAKKQIELQAPRYRCGEARVEFFTTSAVDFFSSATTSTNYSLVFLELFARQNIHLLAMVLSPDSQVVQVLVRCLVRLHSWACLWTSWAANEWCPRSAPRLPTNPWRKAPRWAPASCMSSGCAICLWRCDHQKLRVLASSTTSIVDTSAAVAASMVAKWLVAATVKVVLLSVAAFVLLFPSNSVRNERYPLQFAVLRQ